MKTKPFWETKINPIIGYIVESWTLNPIEETYEFRKKRKLLNKEIENYE